MQVTGNQESQLETATKLEMTHHIAKQKSIMKFLEAFDKYTILFKQCL